MTEGPELHRKAAKLDEEFAGSRIVAVETRLKKARAWLEEHPGAVEGLQILRIYGAGKNMLWELEDSIYFHMHLLMYGKIKTYSLRHKVGFERATRALIVSTTRQAELINVQVFNIGIGDPFCQVPALREIGPDMCAVPFNRELFLEWLNRPDNLNAMISDARPGVQNFTKSTLPEANRLVHDLRDLSTSLRQVTDRVNQQGIGGALGPEKLPDYKPGKRK